MKDFLVEVFSEICLVGVSLQRMVEISLQRFSKAFVGDSSFHFGRENFFRDSLFEFFLHFFFWLGKCSSRNVLVEVSLRNFLSDNFSCFFGEKLSWDYFW